MKRGSIALVVILAAGLASLGASDEKSIKGLTDALIKLRPDVDPGEAATLSLTAHKTADDLKREYGVGFNAEFQNLLIKMGARKKGYCYHYVRDIGARLKELKLRTLELHWGIAYERHDIESNCLVITARNQDFRKGIVLDAWRKAGKLFWIPLMNDHEFDTLRPFGSRFGQHDTRTGIPAWKEDLKETAALQRYEPTRTKPEEPTEATR
jgi:hypothetical protein